MKTSLVRRVRGVFAVATLACLLVVSGAPNRASAQNVKQGQYITEASALLIKLINQANADGYKMLDNSFSIGGGWLTQGANNWVGLFTLELRAGRSYRFLGAGDADATDLDLQVVNPNGQKVAEDVGTEPDAIVNYRPTVTGRYLVRIRLYASKENLPCACLAIVVEK
jgi:hypothetical protein